MSVNEGEDEFALFASTHSEKFSDNEHQESVDLINQNYEPA